MIVEPELEQLI